METLFLYYQAESMQLTIILHETFNFITVLAFREVWESETPKYCPGTSKNQCQMSGTPNFWRYLVIYNKNLEWIYVLFSLRMAVLLHNWEFKNIEVEFLKMSEKIWSPGLPDIWARKSCWQLVQALS